MYDEQTLYNQCITSYDSKPEDHFHITKSFCRNEKDNEGGLVNLQRSQAFYVVDLTRE